MISSKSLGDLLPSVRSMAIHFIAVAEMELSAKWGCDVKIVPTYTFRDDEFQDALYKQGRSEPGNRVTNAKGGESWHNFRCAFDVCIKLDGVVTWDKQYYDPLGAIGQKLGLTWGGDWNGNGVTEKADWDLCHFQFTGGKDIAELRAERDGASQR